MSNWPVYGEITGPIVMVGFGSIGKGTLPLIERHFKFDKKRLVVIDPEDKDVEILKKHGVRYIKDHVTQKNYKKLLKPLLTEGGGQGFCVNLSVDTSSVDIMEFCRSINCFYIDTVVEPWLGFYFDPKRDPAARSNYMLRETVLEARRHHRRLVLRREPRHGVVVREAGPREYRDGHGAEVQGAQDEGRLGRADEEGRRQGHSYRRA
jgi:homospermidine synthase